VTRRYEVEWSAAAEDDLLFIVDYIAIESPRAAERLLTRIESAASSLERFPLRGRRVPEIVRTGRDDIRELVVRPYRLIYRCGDVVRILGIIDGRRSVEEWMVEVVARQR
jgi:plasmid stabilization system protein ParE